MILFSTHRFDMVERLCSRVVMLSQGRVVAEHRVTELEPSGPNSLEARFISATAPPDFEPVAADILHTIQAR